MTNPARELADLLESWRGAGHTSVLQGRMRTAGATKMDVDFWQHVNHGVHLLRELQTQLDQFEKRGRDVSHYRDLVAALHGRVYAPDHPWKNANTATAAGITQGELNQLRVAADALDGLAPDFSVDQAYMIEGRLREAANLALAMPHGPHRERLIAQIELAIAFTRDLTTYGPETIRASTDAVAQTLRMIGDDTELPEETRKDALTLKDQLLVAVFGGGAGNALGIGAVAGIEHLTRMIGG